MELFGKAKTVRLSNCQGKYLWADDDKRTVRQSRRGNEANAIWEVRKVDKDESAVRLRSCYGCYLTASSQPLLLGMTGSKVVQTNPTRTDDLCEWHPVVVHGPLVSLRTDAGTYLRANSGPPPWRNTVTHDSRASASAPDVYWAVEAVEEYHS